jgi:hypothetical protein
MIGDQRTEALPVASEAVYRKVVRHLQRRQPLRGLLRALCEHEAGDVSRRANERPAFAGLSLVERTGIEPGPPACKACS